MHGEYQDLTNQAGQTIRARVLSLEGDQVELERADKQIFKIPLSTLSASDVERIRKEFSKPTESSEGTLASEMDALRRKLEETYPVDERMSKREAEAAFEQAFTHYKAKEFEDAVALWASIPDKRARFADSRRRAGYNVLGRELGRWNEAVVFLLNAYEADPENESVLEDLGRAYLRIDDVENAKLYLSKAKTKKSIKVLEELNEEID